MYSQSDIIAKAWMIKELTNLVLCKEGLSVEKILLCGSYASGKATNSSDIDFIIQLKPKAFPKNVWKALEEVNAKIGNHRIHVIFGTEVNAQRLHEKHKHEEKNYAYKEVNLDKITAQGEV